MTLTMALIAILMTSYSVVVLAASEGKMQSRTHSALEKPVALGDVMHFGIKIYL